MTATPMVTEHIPASATLLNLAILIEPDRQRLIRFAVNAVAALGGDSFNASAVLTDAVRALREATARPASPLDAQIVLDGCGVYLCWADRRVQLCELARAPADATVAALQERLKKDSESTNPELLRRRNEHIMAELDAARQRAASEITELETVLAEKKKELQESLRLAETDSLTGLLNRGAYDTRLREAFLRCRRQSEPLCLLLLDLDRFKEINDTRGHQYGDQYLRRMADALRAAVRQHVDFPCRVGGDEFAIILFSELPIARRVATRVLGQMEQRTSIGIARMTAEDSVDTLVARADAALYAAKNGGRGRYIVAEDGVGARVVSG